MFVPTAIPTGKKIKTVPPEASETNASGGTALDRGGFELRGGSL